MFTSPICHSKLDSMNIKGTFLKNILDTVFNMFIVNEGWDCQAPKCTIKMIHTHAFFPSFLTLYNIWVTDKKQMEIIIHWKCPCLFHEWIILGSWIILMNHRTSSQNVHKLDSSGSGLNDPDATVNSSLEWKIISEWNFDLLWFCLQHWSTHIHQEPMRSVLMHQISTLSFSLPYLMSSMYVHCALINALMLFCLI